MRLQSPMPIRTGPVKADIDGVAIDWIASMGSCFASLHFDLENILNSDRNKVKMPDPFGNTEALRRILRADIHHQTVQ